jgi:transaldolase
MTSVLDQLRQMTVVVGDTGDVEAIREWQPQDCTTNPSLVLKALQMPVFEELFAREIEAGKAKGTSPHDVAEALTLGVGSSLAGIVPGRVSTEVDAALSFDVEGSIAKARQLIAGYEARGVSREHVFIKLASTWEGVRAAEVLQAEGIDCNMTLLFSMTQAVACANVGATLISPFVGRITDYYKAKEGRDFAPEEDPGVSSVRKIYDYYKSNGIKTIVMGASFRNTGQIKALAGCDRLTIAPQLLTELAADEAVLERRLSPETASGTPRRQMDEKTFRWEMNEDPMATTKLADGIRSFNADHQKLIDMIATRMS